ncbi:hypothetical protein NOCA2480065 [metagenome]|uniref:Uncharacterized protein n=1 Tax=metagenome TaxID=256318 RepID=A0A2P2C7Q6_9ZZZZ
MPREPGRRLGLLETGPILGAGIARLRVMDVAWEYAVLRVYKHFPDPNTGQELWALQTRGRIEHGEIATDDLELFNDLGRAGWRVRFRSAGSGMPDSKLLDRYVRETTTGTVIGTDEWLLERRLETRRPLNARP